MYSEGLLKTIEDIDMMSIDSEISVLESMIDTYDKAISILEQSDAGTDVSTFDIFQEGEKWDKFKTDADAPILGNKDESVGKRIAMIIPRLITAIIRLCQSLLSKNKKFAKRMKKDVEHFDRMKNDTSEEDFRNNAPTRTDENGEKYKRIKTVLFGNKGSGDIDRVFLDKEWFSKCETELTEAFNKSSENSGNFNKHLEVITTYVKSLSNAYNKLQSRYAAGGEEIELKDSEFVMRMEEFAKKNDEDIDACNKLISFVEKEMGSIRSLNKDLSEDDSKIVANMLRQYSRFLKVLNSYSTCLYQAWEHDKGARDQ